jgi:hypothetical protein
MRRSTAAVLAVGSVAAVVAACNLSSASSVSSTGPTNTDAAFVSQGVETSVESAIASFLGGLTPPTQAAGVVGAARTTPYVPYLRLAHVPFDLARSTAMHRLHTVVHARQGVPSCVTISPNPPTDTDGDGIPDTVTMTAQPNCSFTDDSLTFSISGSLIEGDQTPTVPDADYTATANNMVIGFSSGGDSATIGLNGTATVTETTGSLSQNNDLTLTLMSTGSDTVNATYGQNWMVTFTYTGSTLLGSSQLPSGTLNITGTTNYSGNGNSYALAITTPTALTFDPSCGTSSQVTAGAVQATFSGTSGADYVTLTWTGCGAPTVDFVSSQS